MAEIDPKWERVGAAIRKRFDELSLTFAEVGAAGGPTDKTLRGYMAGQPIVRADKRRELCRILGWKVESIESMLGGGDPVLAPDPDVRRALERQSPGADDGVDMANRLARLSPSAQQFVKDYIDAEERRMGGS